METATSPATPATAARHGERVGAAQVLAPPVRVIQAYGSSQSGNNASGLAFNAFMAMFPMILGALPDHRPGGEQPGHPEPGPDPPSSAPSRAGAAPSSARWSPHDLHHYAGLLGIVGVLGLLWGCTNFFASLEFCLGRIFDIGQRGFLRQRAMGAVMMLALVAAPAGRGRGHHADEPGAGDGRARAAGRLPGHGAADPGDLPARPQPHLPDPRALAGSGAGGTC